MNFQQVKGDLRVIDLARKWTLDMRKCAFEARCDFFTMDQIVRAATSVHLNLVEGSHSIYPGVAAQSFSTARASLAEALAGLDLLHAEGRVSADQMSELRAAGDEISRMTWALIRYKLRMKG